MSAWSARVSLVLAVMMCAACEVSIGASPSVTGNSGMITIPTAEIVRDREVILGAGYLPGRHAVLRRPHFGDQIYFITIGYLPFLETTWCVVRSDQIGKRWGIGDRAAFFRFRILSEKEKTPAIVLGLHDPFGLVGEKWAHHFCASYLVASKRFRFCAPCDISVHLGYGGDWIKAADHQFVGLFGGVSLRPTKFAAFMFEYDAQKFNLGMRFSVFGRAEFLLALLNTNSFSGAMSYRFSL